MRTDDGRIVQECLDGESTAFGILVDKYKAGIYAFIYDKLRNFHDAQDVTHTGTSGQWWHMDAEI